jgi:phosphoribosylformimino-5-aminoimidazole carboxamide ribonucleotide (ProFAR) isomerase
MFVIPSLSLEPDASRAYATAIANAVEEWERAGFSRIQLSLSGFHRQIPDERILEELLRDLHGPIQVSARFAATEGIDVALAAGAEFVVLGGRALDEFDWLSAVAEQFPGQLLLSSPLRERRARTRGAVRTLPLDLRDLATEVAGMPLAGMLVEMPPDEVIGHPELALLEDVAEELEFELQVSVGSPDLGMLRDLEFRGVAAVVIDAASLSAAFDGQTLARSFTD